MNCSGVLKIRSLESTETVTLALDLCPGALILGTDSSEVSISSSVENRK